MAIETKKFSEFTSAGDLSNNETTVGIFAGANASFDNPWTFLSPGTTSARPAIVSTMYYRLRLNTDLQQYEYYDPVAAQWVQLTTEDTFDWFTATTDTVMVSNNGYFTNSGSRLLMTLPLVSDVGARISIAGQGSGGWSIGQTAGQLIVTIAGNTTTGVMGSLSSTNRYDSINLVCEVANTQWTVLGGPQSAGLTIL